MSLSGSPIGEVALRSLDTKCALPNSRFSKSFVADIRAAPLFYSTALLHNSIVWGLNNLVRCALEAQVSPSGRHLETPFAVWALVVGNHAGRADGQSPHDTRCSEYTWL